jgi:nitroreductase
MSQSNSQSAIIDAIKNRWSARSFSEQAITKNDLLTVIEAGSWAFSAMNEQPWQVIAAHKGTETYNKILATLMPGNMPWAQHAAALVLTIARTTLSNDLLTANSSAEHDLGAFNATMAVQATAMGIITHPMGGFDRAKAKETFNLTETQKPMAVIALGYLDSAEKLPEPFKTRELLPRVRKPITEIILDHE